jgi:hypothetical protein
MGAERLEIRFETCVKDSMLNVAVQRKKMGMPAANSHPDHRWAAMRVEDTNAPQRQKKRRDPHLLQRLTEPILGRRFDVSEEAERQV